MGGAKRSQKLETAAEAPARGHPIARFVFTVAILSAVFYVGIYLACGTDGFRSYAEEYLENHLGIPVHIKNVHATPMLDIVLSGVITEGLSKKGTPGYRAREAVVRWSVLNRIRARGGILSGLELKDFAVVFAPGESGQWEPAAFEKLGSWVAEWGRFNLEKPSASAAAGESKKSADAILPLSSAVKDGFWDGVSLAIEGGSMSWWDADRREMAAADGIDFEITPIVLPNRRMTHYILTLDNASIGERRNVRDFTFELLKMGSNSIVITYLGDWGSTNKSGD